MSLRWQPVARPLGIWSWYCDVGNGWTATVTDYSQASAPRQPTRYSASANSRMRHVGGDVFTTLQEAKTAAVKLALSLEPCR